LNAPSRAAAVPFLVVTVRGVQSRAEKRKGGQPLVGVAGVSLHVLFVVFQLARLEGTARKIPHLLLISKPI